MRCRFLVRPIRAAVGALDLRAHKALLFPRNRPRQVPVAGQGMEVTGEVDKPNRETVLEADM